MDGWADDFGCWFGSSEGTRSLALARNTLYSFAHSESPFSVGFCFLFLFLYLLAALGFELGAYTLSHSASPFL
jgi:hypothetical protein